MSLKTMSVSLVAVVAALMSPWADAENSDRQNEVIVSVIDTGLRATHDEFNYQGKSSTTDQIIAWYDFSGETGGHSTVPIPGQLWDHRVDDPFDSYGHGTAVASAAVGLNKSSGKEKSFCPGCKLAVAKVSEPGEPWGASITGDVTAALQWAVYTVDADVINISIGYIAPFPSLLDDINEAIADARTQGVLVIVANGNGWGNVGLVPGEPGWASPLSPNQSLSVGASPVAKGATTHTDPEVVANYSQTLASNSHDHAYVSGSGTSFSSPLVAGMAARLMQITIAAGKDSSPDYIETLLKYTATDTVAPPMWEGYGVLDETSFSAAYLLAWMGALPARPFPDPSGLYVEQLANRMRTTWNQW